MSQGLTSIGAQLEYSLDSIIPAIKSLQLPEASQPRVQDGRSGTSCVVAVTCNPDVRPWHAAFRVAPPAGAYTGSAARAFVGRSLCCARCFGISADIGHIVIVALARKGSLGSVL